MSRRGKRVRLAKGIYRDKSGTAATVKVGSGATAAQREQRYPHDTPLKLMQAWQRETAQALRDTSGRVKRGTLVADGARYLRLVKHLNNWTGVRAEVRAWIALYGPLHRSRLTADHVLAARVTWRDAGRAPKTINNRVDRLRTLYRTLDATPARPTPPTPCDTIDPLPLPDVPAVAPDDALVGRVAARLEAAERAGVFRSSKTRARFLVLATTGKRPSEVARAQPEDVNLVSRVWKVRNGKGGWGPGIYLNDDMLAAWRLFVDAQAFGEFSRNSYARRLRQYGWPAGLRPYNLRHGVGQAMSGTGVDLSDIQAHYGHKRISTTRKHYVPVLNTRLEGASRAIDGRFTWPSVPAGVPAVSGRGRR